MYGNLRHFSAQIVIDFVCPKEAYFEKNPVTIKQYPNLKS
jgi:hypothetical protein